MITAIKVESFLKLAKRLNFTHASEELYMTQQGLSRLIASLEEDLGFKLFERKSKKVELTPEGKIFYELFKNVEKQYYESVNACLSIQTTENKTLRVGYQNMIEFGNAPFIADRDMKAKVEGFILDGELNTPYDLQEQFRAGRLDMIMVFKRFMSEYERYEYLLIKKYPVVLMSSETEEIIPNVLLLDEKEQYLVRCYPASEDLQTAGLRLPQIQTRANRESVFTAVELGQGYCLGTPQSQIESRKLKYTPTELENELICIWRKGPLEKLASQFAYCLKEAFK